jgi:glycosyltransferase involved in cell wall biosynthesis
MQGGVGDCTHELGSALIQLGHEVAVVTSARQTQRSTLLKVRVDEENNLEPTPPQRDGVPALHTPPTPRGAVPPRTRDAVAIAGARDGVPTVYPVVSRWNWGSWQHVLETVRTLNSDILHIQYQTAGYGMHPAINFVPLHLRLWYSTPHFRRTMQQRPRVAVTFHDLRVPYLFPKAGAVRKWVTLSLARWSDAVIATNVEDYQLLRTLSFGHPSLHLIPIGSNIAARPPAGYDRASWRRSLGVDDSGVLLCYFGFVNESKGGETLFRALAEVVRRGRQVKLLMIGGQVGDSDPTNMAYAEHVQALGIALGLRDHILWTGYTDAGQVSANLFAADICVLPYRDGASYRRGSFMAALAHGLPIVSTRPRVPIDTLVDGDNILLVPADDPLATADAVERLASTPELRARLARGALELARAFTWDSIASKTAQVYAELLGE